MTYPLVTDYTNSSTGLGGLFTYSKIVVPFYDSMLFGVILLVLTFSMYFIREAKKRSGDFPVAFAVGCFATTVLCVIASLLSDFISSGTLGTLIALTILSFIWLFYSDP